MVRFFKSSVLLLCMLLLSSCQEGGEAGDLFGQWRLAGHDTQYISFSGSITLLRSTDETEVFGNFQHVGDSLFIQCYSIEALPLDTVVVEQTFGFSPFNNIRLRIENINSDRLVLSKDGRIWSFDKY
ncbi:MAG: lipocalin-like domain-containing protein [Prevotella sp.]|nr:lipocalin-like domain-containing protein [Prevotella sp.]